MKSLILGAFLIISSVVRVNAQKSEVFAPDGKAVNGYDVVAFFKEGKPVMGSDSLSYTYMDVKWLFSSNANMAAFKADPKHYMPQYGGFCAYGTAQGHKAPTKPDTWTIVNDKLYFNYNLKVKDAWTKDQAALIEKADKNWPDLKDKL
jgi:YHS domain-containing protein